ncbi:MAG: CvpA family protein [Bacteroidaceae bacterium]|nr:CvpA family protein [Bacteroidaceae bacterium]MBQ3610519.1 CvpA family protein [Bacteroidaceae bacterium]
MEVIDIIILILIGVGVIQGLMKGSMKELASVVGFVAGLLLARALFGTVAEQLAPALGTSITIAQILSFILIWVAVPIGCSLVASVLTKALEVVHLGWLNRLAGAMLGAVKMMLLVGIGIYVLEYIDPKSEMVSKTTKKASVLYTPMKELVDQCLPVVKDVTNDIKEVTDGLIN